MTSAAWLQEAIKELGTKEVPGPGSNPAVVDYYTESGHPEIRDDAVAWCSAFANAMLARANLRGTGSLAARSFLNYGTKLPTTNIPRGAICVFRRGSSAWQGHVAFCLRDEGSRVRVIGGNQGDAVTEVSYSKAALIGVRWPETALNSRTLQSGGLSFASLSASEVTDTLEQTQSLAADWAPYLQAAKWILLGVALAAAGWAAYRFIQKRIRPMDPPEIGDGPSIDVPLRRPNKRKRKQK